jgi:hypothetical protein
VQAGLAGFATERDRVHVHPGPAVEHLAQRVQRGRHRLEAVQGGTREAVQREQRELAPVGADVEHGARFAFEGDAAVLDTGGDAEPQGGAVVLSAGQAGELAQLAPGLCGRRRHE